MVVDLLLRRAMGHQTGLQNRMPVQNTLVVCRDRTPVVGKTDTAIGTAGTELVRRLEQARLELVAEHHENVHDLHYGYVHDPHRENGRDHRHDYAHGHHHGNDHALRRDCVRVLQNDSAVGSRQTEELQQTATGLGKTTLLVVLVPLFFPEVDCSQMVSAELEPDWIDPPRLGSGEDIHNQYRIRDSLLLPTQSSGLEKLHEQRQCLHYRRTI